jgi:hypothetical protein
VLNIELKSIKSKSAQNIEADAVKEELAFNYSMKDPFLRQLILCHNSSSESLPSMFSDIITLFPSVASSSSSSEVSNLEGQQFKLIILATKSMRKIINLLLDSILYNRLSNFTPDLFHGSPKNIETDSLKQIIAKRTAIRDAFRSYWVDGYSTGADWLVLRKLQIHQRHQMSLAPAIQKLVVVLVRVAWFLMISNNADISESLEIVGSLLAWHGIRGSTIDEVMICMLDQLKNWSVEQASDCDARRNALAAIVVNSLKQVL